MRRVLMVAYHFPPFAGSSGVQRTLRFVQHLHDFGWQPHVLTIAAHGYEQTSEDLLPDIPHGVPVFRAFGLDAGRHLSVAGKYPSWLARPDRWMTWKYWAVPAALRIINEQRVEALWSTYPIATAHEVGYLVHKASGLPWIADFRDPMAQDGYPTDRKTWMAYKRIEEKAVTSAYRSVFTTPGAAADYRKRYPQCVDRILTIENGFDEESFRGLSTEWNAINPGLLTLLHSGVVYPSERDPTALFKSLRILHDRDRRIVEKLRVRFRASSNDRLVLDLAKDAGVSAYVEVAEPIAYRAALQEMLNADALLLLQAANCNAQVPAKLYEYVRCGRPIVALSDPAGDTIGVLRRTGLRYSAPLDAPEAIAATLTDLVRDLERNGRQTGLSANVEGETRTARTQQLATILDSIA